MKKLKFVAGFLFFVMNLSAQEIPSEEPANAAIPSKEVEPVKGVNSQEEKSFVPTNQTPEDIKSYIEYYKALKKLLDPDMAQDKKERVELGLSFAFAAMNEENSLLYRVPTIDPVDQKLRYQPLDAWFVLISTTMTVSPFLYSETVQDFRKKAEAENKQMGRVFWWWLERSGISVNVNFYQLNEQSKNRSFNKIVEGGLGYSFRLNKSIYASVTREIKFFNALNDSFREGEQIIVNKEPVGNISQLNTASQDYFHTKSLLHWSYRLIINF